MGGRAPGEVKEQDVERLQAGSLEKVNPSLSRPPVTLAFTQSVQLGWCPDRSPSCFRGEAVGVSVVVDSSGFPVPQPSLVCLPFAAKAGYCFHVPPLGDVFDEKDCSTCQKNGTCSVCSSDSQCPDTQKCCPGDCGYVCQEAIFGEGKGVWVGW